MIRRNMLLGSGVVLSAVLAGCSSDETSDDGNENGDSNGGGDEDGNGDGNESNSNGESTGEAEFELESLDMPDEVEIGEEWSCSVTIANTGDADGEFFSPTYSRLVGDDFTQEGSIYLEIPTGGSSTEKSDVSAVPYLTSVIYRIEALNVEEKIQPVPRSLSFGESYENPEAIVTTAQSVELRDVYSFENGDGSTATEEASAGKQWAVLELKATNKSGTAAWLPFNITVTLLAEGTQYDYFYVGGGYDGGKAEPGVTRSGQIIYEIPDTLAVDDLAVAYSDENSEGEWSVRWRPA